MLVVQKFTRWKICIFPMPSRLSKEVQNYSTPLRPFHTCVTTYEYIDLSNADPYASFYWVMPSTTLGHNSKT